VKVQGHEQEGQIYPPLLVLKYGEVTQEDIEANVEVPLTFNVEYEMENTVSHAIEVGFIPPHTHTHTHTHTHKEGTQWVQGFLNFCG
jgi:hypothetical protein